MRKIIPLLLAFSFGARFVAAAEEPPLDWIDSDTGHRVVRLSREPGSASLYFHQNAYTPDGKKLIITSPTGISTIDLQTHDIDKVVEGKVNVLVVGRKSGLVYYTKRNAPRRDDGERCYARRNSCLCRRPHDPRNPGNRTSATRRPRVPQRRRDPFARFVRRRRSREVPR